MFFDLSQNHQHLFKKKHWEKIVQGTQKVALKFQVSHVMGEHGENIIFINNSKTAWPTALLEFLPGQFTTQFEHKIYLKDLLIILR